MLQCPRVLVAWPAVVPETHAVPIVQGHLFGGQKDWPGIFWSEPGKGAVTPP